MYAKQWTNRQSLEVVSGHRVRRWLASPHNLQVERATLLFDSAHAAVVEGFRATAASARQTLYKAGSVCIDMYIQPKSGSESMMVTGQLMDSLTPSHGMGGVLVSLMCDGNTVSRKKTNAFGEFDFGFEAPRDVQLAFGLDNNGRTVVVPVPDSAA
jgi:hypothetical protein